MRQFQPNLAQNIIMINFRKEEETIITYPRVPINRPPKQFYFIAKIMRLN
jgi:hypothetical protein